MWKLVLLALIPHKLTRMFLPMDKVCDYSKLLWIHHISNNRNPDTIQNHHECVDTPKASPYGSPASKAKESTHNPPASKAKTASDPPRVTKPNPGVYNERHEKEEDMFVLVDKKYPMRPGELVSSYDEPTQATRTDSAKDWFKDDKSNDIKDWFKNDKSNNIKGKYGWETAQFFSSPFDPKPKPKT